MEARSELASPIAFESHTGVRAFFSTLFLAFDAVRNTARFGQGDSARAWKFFVLTFPFWAAIAGIVPFTFLVQFGPEGHVEWMNSAHVAPSLFELALDVVRAMGLGVAFSSFHFLLLALPYVQLSRALSDRGHDAAGVRALLYLGWLVPFFQALQHVLVVSMPREVGEPSAQVALLSLVGLLFFVPIALFYWNLRLTARVAHGTGPITSWFALIVAILISQVGTNILEHAVIPYMPSSHEPSAPATAPNAPPSATPASSITT